MSADGPLASAALIPDPEAAEAALWTEFKAGGSLEAREKLFSLYFPLARRIAARRFRSRSGADIELPDLRQLATVGLLEAIDRYDPALGPPFKAFAGRWISGTVLGGIAKMSELREQLSFRARVRRDRLRSLSDVEPDVLSVADAMRALADLAVGLAIGFMVEGAGLYVADGAPDPRASAYQTLAWKETMVRIMAAISQLADRDQAVIRHHYLNGLSFDEIGGLLGLSKTRISQIHKAAIERLRERLPNPPNFQLQR
ncbi:MAG: sigma-70 family RNA polymerase sigma factor [Caulobacterales bacterium]